MDPASRLGRAGTFAPWGTNEVERAGWGSLGSRRGRRRVHPYGRKKNRAIGVIPVCQIVQGADSFLWGQRGPSKSHAGDLQAAPLQLVENGAFQMQMVRGSWKLEGFSTSPVPSTLICSDEAGCADDAGLIAHFGGHDFNVGRELEMRKEFVRLFARASTDDDEVGRK